jgi:iron complex transport system ATP-binding protein
VIACKNLSLTLGGHAVLDDVSLQIAPRELCGIVGPNGAGKSSLLQIMGGVRSPDRGAVELDDRPVGSLDVRTLAKERAFLLQDTLVSFDFRVEELVLLGRAPHEPVETAACRTIAAQAIDRMGLTSRATLAIESLSGGERQRAHLARVLTQVGMGQTGKYLLLDEPVSSQDPYWQLQILDQLRSLAAAGLGIAVVLHDLNLAARFCDSVALIAGGRLLHKGSPREVLTRERLGKAFGVEVHVGDDPFDATRPLVSFRAA